MPGLHRHLATAAVTWALLCGCDRDRGATSTSPPKASARNVATALDAAEQYFNSRNHDAARLILAELIGQAPDNVTARELYGQVLLAMALSAVPGSGASKTFLQQSYEQFEAAADLEDDSAGLHQSAGEVAQLVGELEVALAHFKRAAHLDATNAKHPLYAGFVLQSLDRLDEARDAIERSLAIKSDEPAAHASLGAIALAENNLEEAQAHIETARRLAPDDLGVRVLEARRLRAAGHPNHAIESLISLPASQRISEAVVFQIAAAYGELGRHADAAQWWERRLQESVDDPRAWYAAVMAGNAQVEAGRPDRARELLRQAVLLAPTEPEVRSLAARLRAGQPADQPSSSDPSSNG